MTSINFGWEDLWSFHNALDDPSLKSHIQQEVIGDGWLARQSEREQLKVLEHAPEEFIRNVVGLLKPSVQIQYGHNPYLKERK